LEKFFNAVSVVLQAVLGGIDWLLGTYVLIVLGIVLVIFILFGVLTMIKPRSKHDKAHKEPKKAPEPVKRSHDPHHASGGDHGHDDHHSTPLSKQVLTWSLAIAAATIVGIFLWWLLVGMGAGQKPGLTHVERLNRHTQLVAARATPAYATCTPEPVEWQSITALPKTKGEKSRMIPIPDCHRIWFCDKKQDPECTATSFADTRFRVLCTTRTRTTELPLDTSGDQAVNACRPESKGGNPVELTYTFVFSPV